jgi:hypothetical protein
MARVVQLVLCAAEDHMKVQTDVKAGGLLGIGLVAIVVVDLNLFGGCHEKKSCGGGCS